MQKTLYIALCDTNFADRKQMERLLDRESDKRLNSCVFYMDTFGSKDALLNNPRVYDAYFLDIPNEEYSAYDLAKGIQAKGILSPIIFCNSSMDYKECGELLPNTVFLNKPILVADLSLILDEIIIQKQEQYIPTVEVRTATEVLYLTEKEILYCENKRNSHKVKIHHTNGSIIEIENFIANFYTELIPLETFFMLNKNIVLNTRYIQKIGLFKVTLTNGISFKFSFKKKRTLKSLLEKIS